MKKLFFIIVLLACKKISAQEHTGSRQYWNQKIEIGLEKNQKLIVSSNVTPLIMNASHISFDSLFSVFENLKGKLPAKIHPLNSATYVIQYNDRGYKQSFLIFDHENKTRAFTMQEDDLVAVKTSQDSVIFSYVYSDLPKNIYFNPTYKNKLPEKLILNYCFVLNNISNLEDLDPDYMANQIKNGIDKIDSKISDAGLYGNPQMKLETGNALNLSWDYKTDDFLAITGRASGGWVREKFIPELGISAELILKGKYGFGLGVNQFFHFQNPDNQNFNVRTSTFANVQFSPRKTVVASSQGIGKISTESIVTISAGYMIRDNSGFFPKNTWRISATFPVIKHLYAEPELFFNDTFKRVYPGIRIKIM